MASIFAKFFGRTVSEAAAYAAGVATAPTLHPIVRALENETWSLYPDVPLAPGVAAAVAAENVDSLDRMTTEATYSGVNGQRFLDIYGETLNAPGVPQLLELLRRELIETGDLTHGLRKAKLEPMWDAALKALRNSLLDPAVLAVAIQRGIIADPGILPVEPPTGTGRVPAFPVFPIDAVKEAAGSGIDLERLSVMVGNVGLPASAQQAASAYFRGIIELDDYYRAISEGNTRNEWRDAILEQARQILTANQYAELELRGFLTPAQRRAGTAKHGMTQADSDLLFDVLGRAINVHAVTTGLARGGRYPGTYANVPEPFRSALERSNIRPEWAELAYANRYSYPSAFVVRALLTDGALTEAEGEQIFLDVGYPPDLAHKVAVHYAGGGTATGDPNVKKAHTKAWGEAQASYIARESTAADVQPIFTLLGIDTAAQTEIVTAWDEIRALVRKQLSPAQVKKAYTSQALNPSTGVAWSFQDAIDALIARGYDHADATTLLEE